MPVAPLIQRIRQLIGEDQLDLAIQLLIEHVDGTPLLDEILLQQARYTRVLRLQRKGTSTPNDIDREVNKISKHLLAFVRQEEQLLTNITFDESTQIPDLASTWRISIARARVSTLMLKAKTAQHWLAIGEVVVESDIGSRKLVVDCLNELTNQDWAQKERIDDLMKWQLTEEGQHKLSAMLEK